MFPDNSSSNNTSDHLKTAFPDSLTTNSYKNSTWKAFDNEILTTMYDANSSQVIILVGIFLQIHINKIFERKSHALANRKLFRMFM